MNSARIRETESTQSTKIVIKKNIKDDTVRIIKLECKEMEFEKEGGRRNE
jgi:hypothetical protein